MKSTEVAELLAKSVAPNVIALQVTKLMGQLDVEMAPRNLVPLRQLGAQLIEGSNHSVLLIRLGGAPDPIREALESLVGSQIGPFGKVDAILPGAEQRHLRTVPREKLKARYVTAVITQRWVQSVFTTGMGERIRKRWERVDLPVYAQTWTAENFGNEIEITPPQNGRKLFSAEGGFEHFSQNRTNIAVSKFWSSEISEKEDAWRSEEIFALAKQNRLHLAAGDADRIEDVGTFSPRNDVLVHDIRVSVRDMPLKKYPFFLGDNCIYVEESPIALEALGIERSLPHPGEIHCTAISVWEDSASYDRSIGLPKDCPLLLTGREQIRIPTCFSRHRPHSLDAEDFSHARVRIEIEYTDLDSGYAPHKFIRIPYLDQYPDADKLILPDRPWYQAWDRKIPLDVKGFAVYFSPKAAIEQDLRNLAIYAIDESGKEVPGKRIELPDQLVGGGMESVSLTPPFVEGHIRIEPGEYLSASGLLAGGTPSADCAIFVLVEIPADRVPSTFTNPLFRSNGVANLGYLRNGYNADRVVSRPTPAGLGALEALATSQIEPWRHNLGYEKLPSSQEQRVEILEAATTMLFVD